MPITNPYQQQQPTGQQMPGQQTPLGQPQGRALPATGIQQQVQSIMQAGQGLQQFQGAQALPLARGLQRPGGTNLNDLAENLARGYGVRLGAAPLVDEQGNFTRMPTSGQEAVAFQFISQAIADEQNRRQQQSAQATLSTGLGQVQRRGRGSLAAMQSGLFQELAQVQRSIEYRAKDFSYFVQKEQLEKQEELVRRQEKLMKKRGRSALIGTIAGAALGSLLPGIGTAAGASLGGALGGTAAGVF